MQPVTETIVNTLYVFPSSALITAFAVVLALLLMIFIAVLRVPGAMKARSTKADPVAAWTPAPVAAGYAGVEPQVVAAIAAAIASMGEGEGKRLVVRSVRRAGNGWAEAGRKESLY